VDSPSRWICIDCRHEDATSRWCPLCRKNSAIYTSHNLGVPRDPVPPKPLPAQDVEKVLKNARRNFGYKG
jgi:hypothetical protein